MTGGGLEFLAFWELSLCLPLHTPAHLRASLLPCYYLGAWRDMRKQMEMGQAELHAA